MLHQTMTRPTAALLALSLLALAVAGGAAGAAAPPADGPTLQQQEADGAVVLSAARDGDSLVVTLSATADDVAGYQANVTYDPSVLRVRSVDGADFEDPVANVDADRGWLMLTQSQVNGTDDPTLARITFDIVGDAGDATDLGFVADDTSLNDAEASDMTITYQTAGPTTVPSGDLSADQASPSGDDATPADATPGGDATPGDVQPPDDDGGDGLLSNTLLLGVGVGLGVGALLAVGVVVGMRLGDG